MKTRAGLVLLFFCALLSSGAADDRGTGVAPVSAVAPGGNAGLFVGVNDFPADPGLRPLRFAVNDAVAQCHLFVVELKLLPAAQTRLAISGEPIGAEATQQLAALKAAGVIVEKAQKANIQRNLAWVTRQPSAAADMVVVSVSSHGFEADGIPYALPADGVRSVLADTGLNLLTVQNLMAEAKAGKKLLLIDVYRERATADGKDLDAGMTAQFQSALTKAEDQAVLASCGRGQVSCEDEGLRHGLFTYQLIEGLRGAATANPDGYISLGTVKQYLATSVPAWITRNKQDIPADKIQTPWFVGPIIAEAIPLAVHTPQRPATAYDQAVAAAASKHWDAAIPLYRQALTQAKADDQDRVRVGLIEALQELKRERKEGNQEQDDEIRTLAAEVLSRHESGPLIMEPVHALTSIHIRKQEYEEVVRLAQRNVDHLDTESKRMPTLLLAWAVAYFRLEQYNQAYVYLMWTFAAFPDAPEAKNGLKSFPEVRGTWADDPDLSFLNDRLDVDSMLRLAALVEGKWDTYWYDRARQSCEAAIASHANDEMARAAAHMQLARIYTEGLGVSANTERGREHYQDAMDLLRQAIAGPLAQSAAAHFMLARCREELGDTAAASADYERLSVQFAGDPVAMDALIRLGKLHWQKREYAEAAEVFRRGATQHPKHPLAGKAMLVAGNGFMHVKQYQEAIDTFALVPTCTDDHEIIAESLYWSGDSAKKFDNITLAYSLLKKCTGDYPESKWAKFARGLLLDPVFEDQ